MTGVIDAIYRACIPLYATYWLSYFMGNILIALWHLRLEIAF